MVWSRIPFATANLVTACTAIRANLGVAFYAYIFAILAGAWSVVWALALIGVFDRTYDCDDVTGVCTNPSYGLLFLLFLAYFFVQQVIQVRDTGCIRKIDRGVPWIRSRGSRHFLVFCFFALQFDEYRTRSTSWSLVLSGPGGTLPMSAVAAPRL